MSNRSKGRAVELMCKKCLESKGWLVELTDMPKRWKTVQDLWGIFDIAAIRKQDGVAEKLFIQCKLECGSVKEETRKLRNFKHSYLANDDLVQLWNWRRRHKTIDKGWEIHTVGVDTSHSE